VLVVGGSDDFADGATGIGDPITTPGKCCDEVVGCDVHRARLSAAWYSPLRHH
jgi:hypothetical protein